jgi:uncharacterized protein YlxW (UPF0749 family)
MVFCINQRFAAEAMIVMVMVMMMSTLALTSGSEVRVKRADDGGPLEAVVAQLSQQVTSLTAQLTALNNEVTTLKTKTSK